MSQHPSHSPQVPRINRALGQLEAVKRMIEEQSYCVDILHQLRAARNAIKTIELGVLETHMTACMGKAAMSSNAKLKKKRIAELMNLLKKYE